METTLTIYSDPVAKERRLIPVLLESVEIRELPLVLQSRKIVDLANTYRRESEYHQLLTALGVNVKGHSTELLRCPQPDEENTMSVNLPEESQYVKMRIRDLMIHDMLSNGLDIENLWHRYDITFTSLAKRCKLHFSRANDEVAKYLFTARSRAYDLKYSARQPSQDERHIAFEAWEQEIRQLIRLVGFNNLRHTRAINVGIGNGTECPAFYHEFERLVGVDISAEALSRARAHFSKMEGIHTGGELLTGVDAGSQDLYISLRTYQSTLFDIEEALFEAYRVLRAGGVAIISVSNAHRINENVIPGILRGSGREVDLDLPYEIVNKIRASLTRLDFTNVGIRTGMYEVYAYGTKTK